jgi:hypothetical protein
VLLLTATQAIVGLPAGTKIEPDRLVRGRTRAPFHDGFVVVPERRMSPARATRSAGPPRYVPPTPDARVSAIVAAIDPANLQADVSYYSNSFPTRRSDQPDGILAQNDLLARFQALGLSASLFDFDANADDVVADLPGLLEPQKVVIVGAHYDSINYAGASARAPGADDNGSGTAAVLELARVFSAIGQPMRYTVRFCLFASEEFGLYGSDAYAKALVNQGAEVVAMLNTDMNAYRDPTDALDLDLVTNDTTTSLTDDLLALTNLYLPSLAVVKGSLSGGTSDHRSFYYAGYPAAFFFEDLDHYSPYIHSKDDIVGVSANDLQLSRQIVQAVAAGLATYAEPVDLVFDHVALEDRDDCWNPAPVTARITSPTGTSAVACELHYDVGAGDTTAVMTKSGHPDEWIGEIPGQPAGTAVRYSLVATDANGHAERLPHESDFTFLVGVHDRFFFDDLESGAAGWSHGGSGDDFQLGTPAGLSTDPSTAFSGVKCWGNDLTSDGAYPSHANNDLASPPVDATGRHHVHLRYQRWLGVEDAAYDQAQIVVAGSTVWSNPAGSGADPLIDTAWTRHDLDLSALADGKAGVVVEWKLVSDGGLEFGGWNLDDVELFGLEPGVEPEFWRDAGVLSLGSGGTSHLQLNLGTAYSKRGYVVLGGISGTSPGFGWGSTHVDLNFDAVTLFLVRSLPSLPGFLGTTDASGRATATFTLPPGNDPALAGARLDFVAVTLGRTDHATPPIEIALAE